MSLLTARRSLVVTLLAAMSLAPDGDLVLYDDDQAPYWKGIVRIGDFDGDMTTVRRLTQGARLSIELAE